jgi:excisionase family DNA binding protein
MKANRKFLDTDDDLTAKEAAKILNVSNRTIEHHLENIKIKANVSSKSELIHRILTDYH